MAEGEERNLEDESSQVPEEKVDETGSEEEASDGEAGLRFTRKMPNPLKPGPDEISEHEKTHLPFCNWCRHCVRGRGKDMPHRRCTDKPGLPEVHFDFGFMGEETEPGKTLPIICVKERITKMLMGSAVPSKSTGTFIAKRVVAFLREVGLENGDIIT